MSRTGVAPTDIGNALTAAGVRKGDTVLLHSDAIVAAQLPAMPEQQRLDAVIEAAESVLGPDGTLVMPAFTYSFARNEVFDVLSTPSTVGMLSERFRMRAEARRSADPIFSVAAKGRLAAELASLPVKECFGQESVFQVLHRSNALIVCLGCSLTSGGTFVHYVEKCHSVNYRYDKTFSGVIRWPDATSTNASVVYYVRDLARKSEANLVRLQRHLEMLGLLRKAPLGRFQVLGIRAADWFDTAWNMLEDDPLSLIDEGARSSEAVLQQR